MQHALTNACGLDAGPPFYRNCRVMHPPRAAVGETVHVLVALHDELHNACTERRGDVEVRVCVCVLCVCVAREPACQRGFLFSCVACSFA